LGPPKEKALGKKLPDGSEKKGQTGRGSVGVEVGRKRKMQVEAEGT